MSDSIRLLHVDDDLDFGGVVREFLEREDDRFDVVTATATGDGLDVLASEGDVDCVVSDYDMPGGNGIEFLQSVREDYPDLPFVLFTGKGSEEIASEAIAAGVTSYQQKGTGTDQYTVLANRIENAVEAYRSRTELAESQKRLSLLVDQSPVGVIEWDTDLTLIRMNAAAEEILGYTQAELVGHSWESIVPTDERERVGAAVEDAIDKENGYHGINQNVTKDGTLITCEWHNRPIVNDGDVVSVLSIVQDVTEQKIQQRHLEAIVETTTEEAIYFKDTEGRYQFINRAGAQVFNREPAEVVGRLAGELYDSEDGDRLAVDVEVIEHERPVSYEVTRSVDGREHHFLAEKQPYYEDGELVGLVGISRDITDRKRQEDELERKNERLDRFVDIVTHDLRNPLTVAEGRLELAREECESEQLSDVARALRRMGTLIDDLLALAKDGHGTMNLETISLAEVVEACWQNVATPRARLAVDTTRVVRADPDRLDQLLSNLVRNAVEHGGDDVTVTVGDVADGFYVEDDGAGIPADERDRVIERGYSTLPGGTGYGLSIVNRIVQAHGWHCTVAASERGGARFEITGVEVDP